MSKNTKLLGGRYDGIKERISTVSIAPIIREKLTFPTNTPQNKSIPAHRNVEHETSLSTSANNHLDGLPFLIYGGALIHSLGKLLAHPSTHFSTKR